MVASFIALNCSKTVQEGLRRKEEEAAKIKEREAAKAKAGGAKGELRARSHCRLAPPLIHSKPDPLT